MVFVALVLPRDVYAEKMSGGLNIWGVALNLVVYSSLLGFYNSKTFTGVWGGLEPVKLHPNYAHDYDFRLFVLKKVPLVLASLLQFFLVTLQHLEKALP